jgi:hypothetical protein
MAFVHLADRWKRRPRRSRGNAEGFHGRHSSHPARADLFHSLLASGGQGGGHPTRPLLIGFPGSATLTRRICGNTDSHMKTTIELPDELFIAAKK